MKFWLAILVLAWTAVQAAPAAAGPWREMRAAQGQSDRYDRGPQRQRDAGRPERDDWNYDRQNRRLSDEERRGLHRDLDKARREIYRPRRDR
jgi:hypothetical protein